MIDIILIFVGLAGLIVGTITDFQRREVADWINFSLMFAGVGIRAIYSIDSGDWMFLILGLIGLGIGYLIGLIMFYTGQWGGGDCKMIMGLGAIFATYQTSNPFMTDFLKVFFPFFSKYSYNISYLFHFLVNIFIVGAIYAAVWATALAIKNRKRLSSSIKKRLKNKNVRRVKIASYIFAVIGIFIILFSSNLGVRIITSGITTLVVFMPILWIFIKGVEDSCMIQDMKIDDLTEGEWILEDVVVDKKIICGPKDLGISDKQIKKLKELQKKGKIEKVKVKIGIPFVPAFLLAFIVTHFFGNIILHFL